MEQELFRSWTLGGRGNYQHENFSKAKCGNQPYEPNPKNRQRAIRSVADDSGGDDEYNEEASECDEDYCYNEEEERELS